MSPVKKKEAPATPSAKKAAKKKGSDLSGPLQTYFGFESFRGNQEAII